jgi:hypothetical protein
LAGRLGMQDPQHVALLHLRRTQNADDRPRVAVLSSLAGMFLPAASRPR